MEICMSTSYCSEEKKSEIDLDEEMTYKSSQ